MRDEDSVGSSVYQSLVQLTFLCGRGLPTDDLLARFLAAMRPQVPAGGLWLFDNARLAASDHDPDVEAPIPPEASHLIGDLTPRPFADRFLLAPVLPGLTLVVLPAGYNRARSADVVMLMARLLGLVWHSELRGDPAADLDDYAAAKHHFKKRWLRALLQRHGGVSAAARAANLSRTALYVLMEDLAVPHPRTGKIPKRGTAQRPAADPAAAATTLEPAAVGVVAGPPATDPPPAAGD